MEKIRNFGTKIREWHRRWNPVSIQGQIEQLTNKRNGTLESFIINTQDEISELKSRQDVVFHIIAAVVPFMLVVPTLYFSSLENTRAQNEYKYKNRPYLVIASVAAGEQKDNTVTYNVRLKNVGTFPAKIVSTLFECVPSSVKSLLENSSTEPDTRGTIIGNGEFVEISLPVNFTTHKNPIFNVDPLFNCDLIIDYNFPVSDGRFEEEQFQTIYNIEIKSDKSFRSLDANLQ